MRRRGEGLWGAVFSGGLYVVSCGIPACTYDYDRIEQRLRNEAGGRAGSTGNSPGGGTEGTAEIQLRAGSSALGGTASTVGNETAGGGTGGLETSLPSNSGGTLAETTIQGGSPTVGGSALSEGGTTLAVSSSARGGTGATSVQSGGSTAAPSSAVLGGSTAAPSSAVLGGSTAAPSSVTAAGSGGSSGSEVLCASPLSPCKNSCVDRSSDPLHCGACGHACPTGTQCAEGKCNCVTNAFCNAAGSTCQSGRCECGNVTCAPGQICANKRTCTDP